MEPLLQPCRVESQPHLVELVNGTELGKRPPSVLYRVPGTLEYLKKRCRAKRPLFPWLAPYRGTTILIVRLTKDSLLVSATATGCARVHVCKSLLPHACRHVLSIQRGSRLLFTFVIAHHVWRPETLLCNRRPYSPHVISIDYKRELS